MVRLASWQSFVAALLLAAISSSIIFLPSPATFASAVVHRLWCPAYELASVQELEARLAEDIAEFQNWDSSAEVPRFSLSNLLSQSRLKSRLSYINGDTEDIAEIITLLKAAKTDRPWWINSINEEIIMRLGRLTGDATVFAEGFNLLDDRLQRGLTRVYSSWTKSEPWHFSSAQWLGREWSGYLNEMGWLAVQTGNPDLLTDINETMDWIEFHLSTFMEKNDFDNPDRNYSPGARETYQENLDYWNWKINQTKASTAYHSYLLTGREQDLDNSIFYYQATFQEQFIDCLDRQMARNKLLMGRSIAERANIKIDKAKRGQHSPEEKLALLDESWSELDQALAHIETSLETISEEARPVEWWCGMGVMIDVLYVQKALFDHFPDSIERRGRTVRGLSAAETAKNSAIPRFKHVSCDGVLL